MRVSYGDIFIVDLSPVIGSEQGGTRPCVIVQNDVGNTFSTTTIVVPITSSVKKYDDVIHCFIRYNEYNGLTRDGIVLCEQIRAVDKKRLHKKLGSIDEETKNEIKKRIRNCIPLI